MEQYKLIPGFERYAIYKAGFVKNMKTDRVLKFDFVSKGYPLVTLCYKGKTKRFYIHRLVATLFIPNPENKPQVNHINGIMSDSRVENLEWNTAKENIQHAYRIGLTRITQNAKINEVTVHKIRSLYTGKHGEFRSIAKIFCMSSANIAAIIKRKTWIHI